MSQYRVLWPDEAVDQDSPHEPVILQFRYTEAKSVPGRMDVITRARLLFENRRCESCGYPVVMPIELNDAEVNRNRQPIPGTATLVGFRCCGCRSEWSV